MKKFPVYRDIKKAPSYWGLSMMGVMIMLGVFMLSFFVTRSVIGLIISTLIMAALYFILLSLEKKYGSEILTKFFTGYFNDFRGTKIKLGEIKNLKNINQEKDL